MKNYFYGFRGNIVFTSRTLFNYDIQDNKESKNKIFNNFFETIIERTMLFSEYKKREYLLIFCKKYNEIIHCKLARKTFMDKRELTEVDILDQKEIDYPYVNLLINLKTQKFLVGSNKNVFKNYQTCGDILQNIINNNISENNIKIEIFLIGNKADFWNYIHSADKIYEIEFKLVVPNSLGAVDKANELLGDCKENDATDGVIKMHNQDGNLNPSKEYCDSFLSYTTNGCGWWKIRCGEENQIISNKKKNVGRKIPVDISYDDFCKKNFDNNQYLSILNSFDLIGDEYEDED